MKREEAVFTIGFHGENAIVDGKSMKQCAGLSGRELVENGLYKAAFISALYENDESAVEYVRETFSRKTGTEYTKEQLSRVFGVFRIHDDVKVRVLS